MSSPDSRELIFSRLIPAPRANVYRAWTEPRLLEQWFCPRPWRVAVQALDVRPGGELRMTMHGPDGEAFPNHGVYLEVIPHERLVSTDAYTAGWQPSEKPFMTLIVTFEDADGGTLYTARARHWNTEDRARHEAMGFAEGWGAAATQLAELAASI